MATQYLQSDCSIGLAKEATYGTAVTVDQHLEFTSESLQKTVSYLQGAGLRSGRVGPSWARRVAGKIDAAGDIVTEANSIDTAVLLEAAFGKMQTGGSASPYTRLFTCSPGGCPPSYTIQKGIPTTNCGQSIAAHTFSGMVCSQLQINAANDAILELTASWVGKDMVTDTALVNPAYTAGASLFNFHSASLAVGGTVTAPTSTALATGGTATANVRDLQLTLDNALDGAGWNFGGAGKRSRPPAYGRRAITGQFTAEFDATTLRDASLSGTGLALLAEFTAGEDETLQIVIPKIGLDSNVPNSNGGDVITQQFNFTGYEDDNHYAYAVLQNAVAP